MKVIRRRRDARIQSISGETVKRKYCRNHRCNLWHWMKPISPMLSAYKFKVYITQRHTASASLFTILYSIFVFIVIQMISRHLILNLFVKRKGINFKWLGLHVPIYQTVSSFQSFLYVIHVFILWNINHRKRETLSLHKWKVSTREKIYYFSYRSKGNSIQNYKPSKYIVNREEEKKIWLSL